MNETSILTQEEYQKVRERAWNQILVIASVAEKEKKLEYISRPELRDIKNTFIVMSAKSNLIIIQIVKSVEKFVVLFLATRGTASQFVPKSVKKKKTIRD